MLQIIGEALLIATRMDRMYPPAFGPHRPAHEGSGARSVPARPRAAGA
jgi:hypothetical protein